MPESAYGLVELAFTFGLVVIFGVWQLRSIETTRKRLEEERRKERNEN